MPSPADLAWTAVAIFAAFLMFFLSATVALPCRDGYRASLASFGYVECEAGR